MLILEQFSKLTSQQILEEAKETILNFAQGTVKVL